MSREKFYPTVSVVKQPIVTTGERVEPNREADTRSFTKLREASGVEIRDWHVYVTDVDALNRLAQVSGEYEGNVDTALTPPRVQYTVQHRARQRKETSLDMGHFSLSSREPTPI